MFFDRVVDFLKKNPLASDRAGTMARTPSFVPESVGKDIGARMGGTFAPDAVRATPPSFPPRQPEVPLAQAIPNAAINPRQINARTAKDSIGEEYKQRMQDMQMDALPEVVSRDPFHQQRYDYVTGGGMQDPNKRDWKETLKNLGLGALIGAAQGGLPGAIGGAAGLGIRGAVDPAGAREARFNAFRLPQLQQQQDAQWAQQAHQAKMAQAAADVAYRQQQGNIAERGMVLKEKEFNQPEWMSPVSVDQNGNPVLLQTNRKGGDYRVLGSDAGIINQNARAEADRKARADIAATTQKGQDTRLDKTLKTRKEIAQGAQAVQVYKHNNPNTGQGGGGERQAAALEKQWASARKRANDTLLTREERDAAFNEAEAAAAEIKQKYGHLYDTDGQGGWSYVRRKQASAPGVQGEVDIERYVSDAIKAGATREQALQYLRDRGYKVP